MINELKTRLKDLGITEEMTDNVISTVADYAKSKIPDQFHAMLDDVMEGKNPDLGSAVSMLGSIKGLFGGK